MLWYDVFLWRWYDILQNRAARIITGAPYLTVSTSDMLRKLNWDSLVVKREKQKAMSMEWLRHIWQIVLIKKHVGNPYELRGSRFDVKLPKVRTDYLKESFAYTGAKLWNALPDNLKEKQSLNHFKKQLELHYLQRWHRKFFINDVLWVIFYSICIYIL